MRTRRKNENRSDWRFTMEHMGRELRKLYPPADTPPGWHALFREQRRRAKGDAVTLPTRQPQGRRQFKIKNR